MKLTKKNLKKLLRKYYLIKKEITRFENKRNKVEELFFDRSFSKERFDRKIPEVGKEIFNKKIELDELEIINMDYSDLVKYGKNFLNNLSNFWSNSIVKDKIKFQNILFPESLCIENYKFRTTKINSILCLIMGENESKIDDFWFFIK